MRTVTSQRISIGRSPEMVAVIEGTDNSKACGNGLRTAAADVWCNNVQPGRAATGLGRIMWMRRVRRGKVLAIRRKLAEGRYDLNRRLSVVTERIIDDVAPGPRHPNR